MSTTRKLNSTWNFLSTFYPVKTSFALKIGVLIGQPDNLTSRFLRLKLLPPALCVKVGAAKCIVDTKGHYEIVLV